MNNESYYPYSLSVQTQAGDLTFSYPFSSCCNSKFSLSLYGQRSAMMMAASLEAGLFALFVAFLCI